MAVGDTCPDCQRSLIEIDHYGDRLIGCVKCNRWGWPGSEWKPSSREPKQLMHRFKVQGAACIDHSLCRRLNLDLLPRAIGTE